MNFLKWLNEKSKIKRNRIVIGVKNPNDVTLNSLIRIKQFANLIIISPYEIKGFDVIISDNSYDLISLSKESDVDGIFRGDFDAIEVYNEINKIYNIKYQFIGITPFILKKINTIKNNINKLTTLLPTSLSNCKSISDKIKIIYDNIIFFESLNIIPKIGIISGGKPKDIFENNSALDNTLAEAEFLVNWFSNKKYEIKNYNHQSEYALNECDIIVYPDGISGNQAARTMLFLSDNIFFGQIITNLPFLYLQNTESFKDYYYPLLFLNAFINSKIK